jgi:predicted nuclease of predicted toxin-antitoxin system
VKLLLDANLDAGRAESLRRLGLDAIHWSAIGSPMDADEVLVRWARANSHVLVTQDKGIAAALVRSGAQSPSVIQIRFARNLGPELMLRLAAVAREHESDLDRGAVVVLDARTHRARVRPIPSRPRP